MKRPGKGLYWNVRCVNGFEGFECVRWVGDAPQRVAVEQREVRAVVRDDARVGEEVALAIVGDHHALRATQQT